MKMMACATVLMVTLGGCERSTTPAPAAGSAPTTQEAVKEDLRKAGEDLKAAGREVGKQIGPALTTMKEEARAAVHNAAEKVAGATATAPAAK